MPEDVIDSAMLNDVQLCLTLPSCFSINTSRMPFIAAFAFHSNLDPDAPGTMTDDETLNDLQ